jgi:hypothetical protein
MGFLFGGCRTFFSEPCLKGAPPSALPPWAGRESGYWNPPPGSPAERAQNGLPPAERHQNAAQQGCRCP